MGRFEINMVVSSYRGSTNKISLTRSTGLSKTLAEMNAIMLAGDPNFRPPRVSGISQKLPDGTFRTIINATLCIQASTAMFADVTLLGRMERS
jgi:hypothetical protein